MLCEAPLDGLGTALARRTWIAAPSARLFYDDADDSLVVEIVEMFTATEVMVHDHLLVEFDGKDPDAMPTRLTLTGIRAAPGAPAAAMARSILGNDLWKAAVGLLGRGTDRTDLPLETNAATDLRASWRGLSARLRGLGVIGVEFIPGLVTAVITDADAKVQDSAAREIDDNSPAGVVSAIADLVDELSDRRPEAKAAGGQVAVHVGGPVDTRAGRVVFYDKPLHDGDEPWKNVDLRALLQARTNRSALIFNDAQALANYEAQFGLGRERATVAVLVVRRGVGAKLVVNGTVADFPMEIGIVMSRRPSKGRGIKTKRGRSIESRSSTGAIITRVAAVTGLAVDTVEDASALAERMPAVADVFWQAGAELASGMAAIQAIVDPDAWAIYAPDALVDQAARSGAAFFHGLATMSHHLDWNGLRPGIFHPRSTTGFLGARAAAVAALGVSGS